MEKLKLIKPTMEYEQQAYEYIQEFKKYNSNISGSGNLDKYLGRYNEYLELLEQCRTNPPKNWVKAETFMLIREADNKLIGMINIRLELNEILLKRGGHIGYSVRPTERKKGYNSYQLYKALEYCKEKGLEKVLITCNKENIASAKSIQKYEGVLENEVLDEKTNETVQRYWINLNKVLKRTKSRY